MSDIPWWVWVLVAVVLVVIIIAVVMGRKRSEESSYTAPADDRGAARHKSEEPAAPPAASEASPRHADELAADEPVDTAPNVDAELPTDESGVHAPASGSAAQTYTDEETSRHDEFAAPGGAHEADPGSSTDTDEDVDPARVDDPAQVEDKARLEEARDDDRERDDVLREDVTGPVETDSFADALHPERTGLDGPGADDAPAPGAGVQDPPPAEELQDDAQANAGVAAGLANDTPETAGAEVAADGDVDEFEVPRDEYGRRLDPYGNPVED